MSTPPPRISLSELWGHARIRDLISITVKCKILKLSTKKCQGCFQAAPPPKKNPGSAYGRLTIHALIPCMDLLLNKYPANMHIWVPYGLPIWDPYVECNRVWHGSHMGKPICGLPRCVPYNSPIKKKEMINTWLASTVADTDGIHVVRLNPYLRQNYSIFMRNFNPNQHKLSNNHIQFSNRNLLCKFEPPSKKCWIRPCFYNLFYFIYMGQPIWDPYGTRLHCPYGSHIDC